MDEQLLSNLIAFLGAFGPPIRMRIAGAIVETPKTAEEISLEIDLPLQQVVKQLERMITLGFVYRTHIGGTFAVDDVAVLSLIRASYQMPLPATPPGSANEKVVRSFIKDNKLVSIPVQHGKCLVVLRTIVERFEPGRRYTEKEVNAVLSEVFDDHCTLRRALVDYRLVERENGVYWRVGSGEEPSGAAVEHEEKPTDA